MTPIENIHRLLIVASSLLVALASTGCEDLPPNDYVPQYIVQGYLVVDQPITGIKVMRSQSLADTFGLASSDVTDADVRIIVDGQALKLDYRPDSSGTGEYFFADSSLKVQPNLLYSIEVRTTDGTLLTGQTLTPERISWIRAPKSTLQYPVDTLNLPSPDSLSLAWTRSGDRSEYLISVRCLDTLDYGKYLEPSTGEPNRRIERPLIDQESDFKHLSRWDYRLSLETTMPWHLFKWYGRERITAWAVDQSLLEWYKLTHWGSDSPTYDPLMSNIHGGAGVFGSAAIAEMDVFLLKNRP